MPITGEITVLPHVTAAHKAHQDVMLKLDVYVKKAGLGHGVRSIKMNVQMKLNYAPYFLHVLTHLDLLNVGVKKDMLAGITRHVQVIGLMRHHAYITCNILFFTFLFLIVGLKSQNPGGTN